MKELESRKIDPVSNQLEVRQVVKEKVHKGQIMVPPGTFLWEMVLVSENPEDPRDVVGMNRETGEVDTDIAIVRKVRYKTDNKINLEEPKITLATVATPVGPVKVTGKIKRGVNRQYDIIDGNIYELAANARNARRKIIAKYFNPNKDAQNETPVSDT